MDNEQYKNLMWHLRYIESFLVNIAETIAPGGICECPICKTKFPAFVPFTFTPSLPRLNARCPNCNSLERHRKIYLLMQKLNWHRAGIRVLHFAPEKIFYQLFKAFGDIDYWTVDLYPEKYGDMVRKAVDITNITFEDDSFDLIMCTHVLEHIPDDNKALNEIHRVLKPKTGIALLNVPISKIPVTLEKSEYNTPELRLKYYGHSTHMRKYGLDYPQRLRNAGFNVQLFEDINDKDLIRYGIDKNEKIFWCWKD